jgi:hypothetical protein
MDANTLLHILRNPYGHSSEEIRNARLGAADLIEELQKKLAAKQKPVAFITDGFGDEVPLYSGQKVKP